MTQDPTHPHPVPVRVDARLHGLGLPKRDAARPGPSPPGPPATPPLPHGPRGDRADPSMRRLRVVGVVLAVAGLALAGAGLLYGLPQANQGLDAAQAMYEAQGVTLAYNDKGQLLDRGTPEGAERIMALLEVEYQYPVDPANFDPGDPVVNTRDELMYQYATITYHVLHGAVAVKLTAADVPIDYRGITYAEAGTYNVTVEKYFAQLDRANPIERQLRDAWSPLAVALTASLAGAHANQAAGEVAQAMGLAIGAIGLLLGLAGVGLVWAGSVRGADSGSVRSPRRP